NGQPTIAYWDKSRQQLTLARPNGTNWSTSVVDSIGGEQSLAFGPDGQPAIAYGRLSSNSNLKLARAGDVAPAP
ncbi:MAG: hypothetical protein ACRCXD_16735, partial [Luteolibacter sp.]